MHNIKSATLEDDMRDCPYCGLKYSVQECSCLASALVELSMVTANTITAQALSDELNAEVIEHVKTGIRPPSEDKGRTVLVPEKMFREMRDECISAAIRRGPVDYTGGTTEITTNGPEGNSYVIVEEKK